MRRFRFPQVTPVSALPRCGFNCTFHRGRAAAHRRQKKPKQQQEIELDAPAPANGQTGAAPSAPVDNTPAPTPGAMTRDAANAKRLFDGEQWQQASLALYKVWKGETNDDEGNKQLAEYHLAIALYRLKLYQASYSIFSEISERAEPPQVQ